MKAATVCCWSMPPPVLDYGPPLPWRQRRRVRRAAILASLAILILSAPWWGIAVWRHAKVLYWQRQCMNFKMPPGGIPPGTVPTEWAQFYAAMEGRPLRSDGTLFIGMLRRPDGEERVVTVETYISIERIGLVFRIIQPGSVWKTPSVREHFQPYTNWSAYRTVTSVVAAPDRQHLNKGAEEVWLRNDDSLLFRPTK